VDRLEKSGYGLSVPIVIEKFTTVKEDKFLIVNCNTPPQGLEER